MNLFYMVKNSKTRAEMVEAVREWLNASPKPIGTISRQGYIADLYHTVAWGHSDKQLIEMAAKAKSDPDIWEGLRRYALDIAEEGEPLAPELAIVLLNDPPKRPKGRQKGKTPREERKGMLYARAVWCVHHASEGRYTLSTSSPNPNNAFEIVAEAENTSYDVVRNNAKGQLKRLDKIVRWLGGNDPACIGQVHKELDNSALRQSHKQDFRERKQHQQG